MTKYIVIEAKDRKPEQVFHACGSREFCEMRIAVWAAGGGKPSLLADPGVDRYVVVAEDAPLTNQGIVGAPSGRYVIRTVGEMTIGEPYLNGWDFDRPGSREAAAYDIEMLTEGRRKYNGFTFTADRRVGGGIFIVDLYDAWHRAKWPTIAPLPTKEPPRIVVPKGPTDAEIVEGYAAAQRLGDQALHRIRDGAVLIYPAVGDPIVVPMTTATAAWSRELRRRTDADKERERNRIVCQGTLPEDY